MSVWLLIVIATVHPFIGPTTVNVDTLVFSDAARCLRNVDRIKHQLETKYDEVKVSCVERGMQQ